MITDEQIEQVPQEDQAVVKRLKREIRDRDLKIASLNMTLSSTKASLSDYILRAKQAEDAVQAASLHWDMDRVGEMISKHMDQRASEKAVQQQALIQTTLVSLGTALVEDDETLRTVVNNVVQGLNKALGYMHDIASKEQTRHRREQTIAKEKSVDKE